MCLRLDKHHKSTVIQSNVRFRAKYSWLNKSIIQIESIKTIWLYALCLFSLIFDFSLM